MESSTVETVTEWDSRPFTDGYDGLRDLADREFTGAVTDGAAWLFMLNGRVIGVFDGSIDSFEDAGGTAYEAPHASLPLLYAMRETGGETRANYYTEKTPLPEVDRTLKAGNFTGYVELSENVLSGDYYTVYQGGKSMSVAFVGNNRRLLAGDEAFERAADEVGIYEVKTVDVDIVEIPDPEPSGTDAAVGGETAGGTETAAGAAGSEAATSAGSEAGEAADGEDDSESADPAAGTGPAQGGVTFGGDDLLSDDGSPGTSKDQQADDGSAAGAADPLADDGSPTGADDPLAGEDAATTEPSGDNEAAPSPESPPTTENAAPDAGTESGPERSSQGTRTNTDDPLAGTSVSEDTTPPTADRDGRAASQGRSPREPSAEEPGSREPEGGADPDATPGGVTNRTAFDDEMTWRESRTIPALDPDETAAPDDSAANGVVATETRREASDDRTETTGQDARRQQPQKPAREDRHDQPQQRLRNAESSLEALRSERDRLAARVEELTAERDRLSETSENARRELEQVKRERDEATQQVSSLETTVAELESTVETLEHRLTDAREDRSDDEDASSPGVTSVSADRALEGTNLFVRYSRKSGPTLDDAFDGTASREEVNENVRLEHHTDFDADEAVVEDRPFDEWLTATIEYGFSEWLATEFIHDVRETRNQSSLEALYQAIPDVDRIEFCGTLQVPTAEGETEGRTFDVVLRDRMGDPLVVANLNDSREPATESMVDALVESASPVGEREPSLAGAFVVTTSYFEPGALETAHDATGGGLLRRDRRKSFVKLSRKEGYHLCLVETRNGEFHVNVPEL